MLRKRMANASAGRRTVLRCKKGLVMMLLLVVLALCAACAGKTERSDTASSSEIQLPARAGETERSEKVRAGETSGTTDAQSQSVLGSDSDKMQQEPVPQSGNNEQASQEVSGEYNRFSVKYGDDVYYMGYEGIYKIDSRGEEELFYPLEGYCVTLFGYGDRLYYALNDKKIHSIGIGDKDEVIVCDGVVTCDFYEDYLFTYTPQDEQGRRSYLGYKIAPQTGLRKDEEPLAMTELAQNSDLSNILMSEFSPIQYKTSDGRLLPQRIAVSNELISMEKYGGYYYYNIADDGQVSLEYQVASGSAPVVLWKKLLVDRLLDDICPVWQALPVDSGIFFTEVDEHAQCTLPLYFADKEGNVRTVLDAPADLHIEQLINYDGQWLYYGAESLAPGEHDRGYYRVNKDTLENQCLYAREFLNVHDPKIGVDIQGNRLFLHNVNEEIIEQINLDDFELQ